MNARKFEPAEGLAYRLLEGGSGSASGLILIHGYGGDEDVMWVLQSVFPRDAWVVALRALYPLEAGGYSWIRPPEAGLADLADFDPSVEAVRRSIAELQARAGEPLSRFILVGFSQGAALSFALVAAGVRPIGLVSLAGFLPEGALGRFDSLPIFWAQGSRDETIPRPRARQDAERLSALGASLAYCEDNVGHKVGVRCMRELKQWLQDLATPGGD